MRAARIAAVVALTVACTGKPPDSPGSGVDTGEDSRPQGTDQPRQLQDSIDAEVERLESEAAAELTAPTMESADQVLATAMAEAAELPEHERRALHASIGALLGLAPVALRVVGDE